MNSLASSHCICIASISSSVQSGHAHTSFSFGRCLHRQVLEIFFERIINCLENFFKMQAFFVKAI